MSSDEAQLLARCRQGESKAWDELFDRYYAATARYVFQLSYDFTREDTEEICQETFLSVIKNLGSFKGESRFQTWLFRIAMNKARDYREHQQALKRGGRKVKISLDAPDIETGLTLDPPDEEPTPDRSLLTSERMAQVMEALGQLGDPCREIIELRYFGDLSYEEISRALHLNLKTVSSRLSKCLDRMEEILRKWLLGEKTSSSSV